jgi:hypothetical protein
VFFFPNNFAEKIKEWWPIKPDSGWEMESLLYIDTKPIVPRRFDGLSSIDEKY